CVTSAARSGHSTSSDSAFRDTARDLFYFLLAKKHRGWRQRRRQWLVDLALNRDGHGWRGTGRRRFRRRRRWWRRVRRLRWGWFRRWRRFWRRWRRRELGTIARSVSMETKLSDLVARLKSAAGDNIKAVVLYGSAVTGEFQEKHSDLNILCIVERTTVLELERLHPIADWWMGQKNP